MTVLQYAGETDIVSDVVVRNVSMNNAQNGARIKVFGGNPDPSTSILTEPAERLLTSPLLLDSMAGGGTGLVKNITYEDYRGTPLARKTYAV